MKIFQAGCFLLCLVGPILAAQADPGYEQTPLPSGPFINRVPSYSAWRITFTYKSFAKGGNEVQAKDLAPTLPQSVEVTRTGPLWHAELTDVSGRKTDSWCGEDIPYIKGPGMSSPVREDPSNRLAFDLPPLLNYLGNHDFPDVNWVSARTYLGTEKGSKYWVFQKHEKGPTVWVDSGTRYPVRWQQENETRIFTFLPTPTENIIFPPDVARMMEERAHFNRMVNTRPAPGS